MGHAVLLAAMLTIWQPGEASQDSGKWEFVGAADHRVVFVDQLSLRQAGPLIEAHVLDVSDGDQHYFEAISSYDCERSTVALKHLTRHSADGGMVFDNASDNPFQAIPNGSLDWGVKEFVCHHSVSQFPSIPNRALAVTVARKILAGPH